MNVSKLRSSTAIVKPLGVTAVITALETNIEDDGKDQAQADKPTQGASPTVELTPDSVRKYLHGISTYSCGEIDSLISGLHRLREKLISDGGRIEQSIVEFATLNQSVVNLTEVVSDGVAHVEAPSLAE